MRACGSAWIEAELGALPGDEDVSTNALPSQTMTDPRQAREFVERTGIDALAVAVGNVHGFTACPVTLDLERLHAIAEKCPVPLVLHGASGLPPEQLRGALSCGVAKVNVNAELRRAYLGAVERSLPKAMPTAERRRRMAGGTRRCHGRGTKNHPIVVPDLTPTDTTEHVTALGGHCAQSWELSGPKCRPRAAACPCAPYQIRGHPLRRAVSGCGTPPSRRAR